MKKAPVSRASNGRSRLTTRVTTEIVLVTPNLAASLLEDNTHNRPLWQRRVDEYAAEMRAGRWHFNGEPIQFAESGLLLNGQHRLWAIVETGLAQTFVIIRGLPADTQVTMDQGTRRSPVDQLDIVGISTDSTVAAAIRIYIRWADGRLFGDQVGVKPTTGEVVAWAQANPELVDLLCVLRPLLRRVPVTPSIALAIGLRFHLLDYGDAESFFASLGTGANLPAGSPVLALRNRLLRTKEQGLRLSERDVIGFFVVAWNARREDRTLSKIQRPNGASWTRANFPEPV